jgi:uncharacterized protein with ATP-grasp and redox domains
MFNSRINQFPPDASEEKKVEYMTRVLKELGEMKDAHGPVLATRNIVKLQAELFGKKHDYSELKSKFNQFVMEKVPFLKNEIEKADDSLKRAVQYGIVGNYIDFAVMDHVDENQLEQLFIDASEYVLDEAVYQAMKQDVCNANRIVYLLDNCGEIVIDKLILEVIKSMNPQAEITAIVRGEEAMNDATMEDAEQVGLNELVKVIGNGSDILGTCLKYISEEARTVIEEADVILSKGQGNFETLQGYDKNIYYIFLCKCEMIAEMFGVPKFSPMLVKENS